ncbi:MAG TPA: hypothetical protein VK807_04485 [Gemmatimonadaceae bacterium]|nr:hypothetical protein [Gemmatimonadaceae bacterium]
MSADFLCFFPDIFFMLVSGAGAAICVVSGVAGVDAAGVLGDAGGVVLGLIAPALVSVVVAG